MAQVVAVVPTINRSAVILNGRVVKANNSAQIIEFFESLNSEDIVLAVMGGSGQNLFVKAQQLGLNVQRIPWFVLEDLVPGVSGTDGESRARALKTAWEKASIEFYPLVELDETILMLRELTRTRLNIQEYRKMATLQLLATARDLEPIMPEAKQFASMRTMFANPGMIAGAKEDERILEQRITALAKTLDIWSWLHPGKDAVLPEVKGLGPSLGGSLIGEILDIKRFPSPSHLRSYARFGLDAQGRMPRPRKGEVSSWNRYLNRAVWLWSTDQMPRYEHGWRDVYLYYKWQEMLAHPEPMKVKNGADKIITKFTLGHLDKRAKRKTGSTLLKYVWGLWTAGANGVDVEQWFRSHNRSSDIPPAAHTSWDHFLNGTIAKEVANGLVENVKEESEKRRKLQPEEESEG
jgi:transposase